MCKITYVSLNVVAHMFMSPSPFLSVLFICSIMWLFIVKPPPQVTLRSLFGTRCLIGGVWLIVCVLTFRSTWTCVSAPTAAVCTLCWGENISKSQLSRPHPPQPEALQVMRWEVMEVPLKEETENGSAKDRNFSGEQECFQRIHYSFALLVMLHEKSGHH